jgi:CO dehydrogenase/acetyl-CoA synthase epsilon subunit
MSVDDAVSPALVGEAMIERAKSFVVVAKRVDDDEAAQILLDAADKANVPVRVAADQVMTALEHDDVRDGITPDMLVHALGCVRPVEPVPTDPTDHPASQAA